MQTQVSIPHDRFTDFARILSAFFVVIIHVADPVSPAGKFWNGIAHFSVPVFLIISGYYLLSRPADPKRMLRRAGRFFLQMLLWSALYFLLSPAENRQDVHSAIDVLRYLLTQPIHLWYLYAAMGLCLFAPILSVFACGASRRQFTYALALTFFLGSVLLSVSRLDSSGLISEILGKGNLPYTTGFIFAFLTGGYLRRFSLAHPILFFGIAAVLWSLTVFLGCVLPPYAAGALTSSFFAPGNLLGAAAVFLGIRRLTGSQRAVSPTVSKIARILAKLTSGIYLLHPLILYRFAALLPAFPSPWLGIPLRALCVFLLSGTITAILKKIPILSKVLL